MMNLVPGKKYRVKTRQGKKAVKRIYKWKEIRFGAIECYVFTSAIRGEVSSSWDGKTLTLKGKHLPAGEISVPHYDLINAENISSQGKP